MIHTQFTLMNDDGERFSLSNVNSGYLVDVSGLGYEYENEYSRIGTKWVRNSSENQQIQLTGDVIFIGTGEFDAGQNFISFIRRSNKLIIECTMESLVRMKDVDLISFDPEMIGINTLAFHLSMIETSAWYSPEQETFTLDIETVDEKEYDVADGSQFAYEYNTEYTYNDYSAARVSIQNLSSFEAPFVVRFNGPISNPNILVYQDGVLIAEADIIGGVNSGDYIEWSSLDGDLHCFKSVDGVITNLVGDFDISKTNFFKLPIGTTTIEVTATSSVTQSITITVYKYYNAI